MASNAPSRTGPQQISPVRGLIAACVTLTQLWTVINAQTKMLYLKPPRESRIFFHCNAKVSGCSKNYCMYCEDHASALLFNGDFQWSTSAQYAEVENFFEGTLESEYDELQLPGLILRYEVKHGQRVCYATLVNCFKPNEVPHEYIINYTMMRNYHSQNYYPQYVLNDPNVQQFSGKGKFGGKGHFGEKGSGGKGSGGKGSCGKDSGGKGTDGKGSDTISESDENEHIDGYQSHFQSDFVRGQVAGVENIGYSSSSNDAAPHYDRRSVFTISLTIQEYEELRSSKKQVLAKKESKKHNAHHAQSSDELSDA